MSLSRINLSQRLKKVAEMVPVSDKIADIGTDHGYIPLYLIKQDIAKHAVAADVSRGSLKKAEQLAAGNKMEGFIECRLGSGLNVLSEGEVDTIIIAGMGGLLISSILEENIKVAQSAKALILQPMTAQGELLHWLGQNGFIIEDEELVREDDRFYIIIKAAPGSNSDNYNDISNNQRNDVLSIGSKLIEKQHPLLGDFLLKKIKEQKDIMENLRLSAASSAEQRMKEIKHRLETYEELYKCFIESGR